MMTKTIFAPRDYYSVYKSCNSSHPRPMSKASASVRWLSDEDEKGGRIVIHLKQSNSTIPDKLDVSILETGIYTITFSGHNGFQHTSKFAIIK